MSYCSHCLMPETRPRMTYNDDGVCNACQWVEEKKQDIDWNKRQQELSELVADVQKRNPSNFDCILPVSGGKDSCYVAYKIQSLGLHSLAITLHPPLAFDIGTRNLEHFIESGIDHIRISPNYEVGRKIAKQQFIQNGQPLMAWMMSVQTAIFKSAVIFDIPFVMFGEEGETEYGGSKKLKHKATYDLEDSIKIYLSGNPPEQFLGEFTSKELFWWMYPTKEAFRRLNPAIAHWSYFENWDPYRNYLVAKEHFGLEELPTRSVGTYTNFAQTDTKLYDLHVYLMFLKFGFGRCTQDACIDIRRGAMSRKQGLALVKAYDGEYPEAYVEDYLRYFDMSLEEFETVLDTFANKSVLHKVNNRWQLQEQPH